MLFLDIFAADQDKAKDLKVGVEAKHVLLACRPQHSNRQQTLPTFSELAVHVRSMCLLAATQPTRATSRQRCVLLQSWIECQNSEHKYDTQPYFMLYLLLRKFSGDSRDTCNTVHADTVNNYQGGGAVDRHLREILMLMVTVGCRAEHITCQLRAWFSDGHFFPPHSAALSCASLRGFSASWLHSLRSGYFKRQSLYFIYSRMPHSMLSAINLKQHIPLYCWLYNNGGEKEAVCAVHLLRLI